MRRVQMVMFRDFAARQAQELNLVVEVENLKDGSVKVVVEGKEIDLKKMFLRLQKGPAFSKVEKIDKQWSPCKNNLSSFTIVRR